MSKHLRCLALCCLFLSSWALRGACADGDRPNVLLICVDDLRSHLGCLGHDDVQTPNIDRLADTGRLFTRHYVSVAACGPSRCCLLTGRFHQSWDCWEEARELSEEPERPVSLPHLFKKAGYRTISLGKVSHTPDGLDSVDGPNGGPGTRALVPFSWDRVYKASGPWETSNDAIFAYAGGLGYNGHMWGTRDNPPRLPYEAADVPDTGYPDGLHAEEAVRQLQDLKERGEPFFFAVGFYKPHSPYCAPKKYWDLYDPEVIGKDPHPELPTGVDPAINDHKSYELTHYKWPWGLGNIPPEQAVKIRHAYYACTSYVDAQIGKVLDELARLELDDSTIVVLWSDHGYHLGDKGMFGKYTCFESAVTSPLIIRVPGMAGPGKRAPSIVETADIYPTLAELCGLNAPGSLDGRNVAALVRDPEARMDGVARSIHWRPHGTSRTLRTDKWRFVEWKDDASGQVTQVELYDHENDPHETANVASEHPDVVVGLTKKLWQCFPTIKPWSWEGKAERQAEDKK